MEEITLEEAKRRGAIIKQREAGLEDIPDEEVWRIYAKLYLSKEDTDIDDKVHALITKAKEYKGTEWFEGENKPKHSEKRVERYKQTLVEAAEIHKLKYYHSDEELGRKYNLETWDAAHKADVATHEMVERLAKRNITVSASDQIAMAVEPIKAQGEADVQKIKETTAQEKELIDKRFEDQKNREELTLENRPRYDALDLQKRWQEINQDLNASTVFALASLKNAEQIRIYLADCYKRVAQLERRKSEAAKRELALLNEHITEVEKQFRGTTRLLQSAAQEDVQGSDQDTDEPRDPR